jgi:hypothetical protein
MNSMIDGSQNGTPTLVSLSSSLRLCLIADLIGVPQGNYIRDLRKYCPENHSSGLTLMVQYYRQSVMPCEWISKLSCSCTNDL